MFFKTRYLEDLQELYRKISEIKDLAKAEELSFINNLKEQGWIEYRFFSEYYGGDIEITYLFHPEIFQTMPKFNSKRGGSLFSHNSYGQCENSDMWDVWFGNIPDDKYVEIS